MKQPKANFVDHIVGYFSPESAYKRAQYRFAYDVLDKTRMRKKRGRTEGTGDSFLTKTNLDNLRGICRDLGRNNPVAKGLLKTEASGVVGSDTVIQARTQDEGWNTAAEELWRLEMLESPCDVSERFDFHTFLHKAFRTYRRDGDMFVIFTDDGLQAIEGECVGTPFGMKSPTYFDVTNGVATKKNGKVLGYYIGKSTKWGYVESGSYKKYKALNVHHFFNPERFSNSRGEPILASSVEWIDKLTSYVDAELVAAHVNACFSAYITTKDTQSIPAPYTGGVHSSGEDSDTGQKITKLQPGIVGYLSPGESIEPVGQVRPATAFDQYILRMLGIIGRPLCLPMALVSLDFHGITNVNARLIFSEARDNWKNEQKFVVMPFVRKVWKYKIDQWVSKKLLKDRDDKYKSEIFLKRWPYVDPAKEASADEKRLKMGVDTRTAIAAREGKDWKDIINERESEEKVIVEKGIVLDPKQKEESKKEEK